MSDCFRSPDYNKEAGSVLLTGFFYLICGLSYDLPEHFYLLLCCE